MPTASKSQTIEIGSYDGGFVNKQLRSISSIATRMAGDSIEHLVGFSHCAEYAVKGLAHLNELVDNKILRPGTLRILTSPQYLFVNKNLNCEWILPQPEHWNVTRDKIRERNYSVLEQKWANNVSITSDSRGFFVDSSSFMAYVESSTELYKDIHHHGSRDLRFFFGPHRVGSNVMHISLDMRNHNAPRIDYWEINFDKSDTFRGIKKIPSLGLHQSLRCDAFSFNEEMKLIATPERILGYLPDLSKSSLVTLDWRKDSVFVQKPTSNPIRTLAWDQKQTVYFSQQNTMWPVLYSFNPRIGLCSLPVEPFYDVQALDFTNGMLTIGAYDVGRRRYFIDRRGSFDGECITSEQVVSTDVALNKWLNSTLKPFLENKIKK